MFFLGSAPLTLLMAIAGAPHGMGPVFHAVWPLMLALLGTTFLGATLVWVGRARRDSSQP